jgi:tRNA dimethylallyltransferase
MKLIAVLGQTATGKSNYAEKMAKELIATGKSVILVNCDSRQIYKELDLGAGKEPGEWRQYSLLNSPAYFVNDVPNFLIDFVDLNRYYNLADYIDDWINLFKNPGIEKVDYVLLVGGTGLWAKAIIDELNLPRVKEARKEKFDNYKLALDNLDLKTLQEMLDETTSNSLSNSEVNNKRRLVNLIVKTHAISNHWFNSDQIRYPQFSSKETIWLKVEDEQLKENIKHRAVKRIEQGMLDEIKSLYLKYGRQRLMDLGLEYGLGVKMIENGWNIEEYISVLEIATWQYARRQRIWLAKQMTSLDCIAK